MRKILFVLAAAVALCSCQPKLVILHLNDTHSHLEPVRGGKYDGHAGAIERAAIVDSVRAARGENNVLLVHAGDFVQGTSYYTELEGDVEIKLINDFRYDVITLGNHEFDNGIEHLCNMLKRIESTKVICANLDLSPFELGNYVKPYAIVEKAGMKIGIIGLLTDITSVVSRSIADRVPKIDSVEAVNKWASYLKNEEKCDMVIALTHIGYVNEGPVTDVVLIPQVRNVDLVVGGHSHTYLKDISYVKDLDGIEVPIVQDGEWGLQVGVLHVTQK